MQLVIFDLDGVIVSTDIYHDEAWKIIAEENNMLFSYEINHMLRGVSSRITSYNVCYTKLLRAYNSH